MAAPEISVGSIAVAKCETAVCFLGELGVCYEIYELEGRPGYSFIFETGRYDGFSPDDVSLCLRLTGRVCETLSRYRFTHVGQLAADFRAGRFAAAFPALPGADKQTRAAAQRLKQMLGNWESPSSEKH